MHDIVDDKQKKKIADALFNAFFFVVCVCVAFIQFEYIYLYFHEENSA